MSVQSLVNHPELTPCGVGGIAFVGALFGRLLGVTWEQHHPHAHQRPVETGTPHPS